MIREAAEQFVDVVVEDGWLMNPAGLLAAMRSPAGRKPSEASLAVADALASLGDTEAMLIIKSALDAAYFSVFNLLDAGMKNSGIQVEIGFQPDRWKSDAFPIPLCEIYRDRVDPHGFVRKPS